MFKWLKGLFKRREPRTVAPLVKIRLLNDGGFLTMDNVTFPVVVNGMECCDNDGELQGYDVGLSELERIGSTYRGVCDNDSLFWTCNECEVVADE